ncbi:MAG TPA: phage tail protein [Blastocatellia bacterium]|jgi:phage tail-like protein|nr:phage tail protein [Blastocatellia bacterium]
MDANGLRFWMISDEDQWDLLEEIPRVRYDSERLSLRLASERDIRSLPGSETSGSDFEFVARSRIASVPHALDAYGTRAFFDAATRMIVATGAVPEEVPIFILPSDASATSLAMGHDGVLYMAVGGRVVMQDRRDRWDPVTLQAPDFSAWRLAAAQGGGVWALDHDNRKLAVVQGLPFPTRPYGPYAAGTFRPCEENPDPPRMTVLGGATIDAGEEPIAIACGPEGRVALLLWPDTGGDAGVRCLTEGGGLGPFVELVGARHPYSLAWVTADRLAVLLPGFDTEAPVFSIAEGARKVNPVGDLYPLRDYSNGPFLNGLGLPPHYPTRRELISESDPSKKEAVAGSAPLFHLSLPSFAARGKASNKSPIDGQSNQTVWHRLYLEADIPDHCGIKVYLASSDDGQAPAEEEAGGWYEHRFGEMFANAGGAATPRGAWVSAASEIPFHPGLLRCERRKNRAGLFTALVQRANRRVRTLRGRYLHVRVELFGDGRATPELAALRVYGSRFSYLNRYLPELYREVVYGEDADELMAADQSRSTRADFLERFLDNLEGILTPIEDRIAAAYLLSDPRTTNEEALEWLGSWIGVAFDPAYPQNRRRRLIEQAPELYRKRGTPGGLNLALDIATGGAVSGGEIVVLEDYRLRRTFATILGADLADEDDPLSGSLAVSGNSFVGDTLFLGDENKKEFLALFSADLARSREEEDAIKFLFDSLSHRVTVLVHQEVEPQDLGLIRRVVEMETPAHVIANVLTASFPFMVGMASLVGVDTYLADKPRPRPVRLGGSHLGVRDIIERPPSLDPRLGGGRGHLAPRRLERPVADAGPGLVVDFGAPFTLNGGASRAGEGRTITRYIWTMIE